MTAKTESAGTTQFAWDFENRLTQVVTPSSGSASYKYDALGRRIQRAPSNGAATYFSYDNDDVVRDKNSDGTAVDYLNGAGVDNKIWQKSGTTQYFFSQDHLGSTTALTNSSGVLVERETYDTYGNTPGSAKTRYGFTGRERDSLTGLMHYRARSYDPQLGRFISEDPIGLAGGINQFAYVGNDPQNGTDPSGLHEIDVHYYLTYYLATKLSCFTADEARLIADADQSTDENEDTAPWPGVTHAHRQRNSEHHGFNPGNEGNLSHLRALAEIGGMNYVAFGQYLHYLQDTYSHRGFENSWYGQFGFNGHDFPFFAGFFVDHTNYNLDSSEEMARATFYNLYEFKKKKGCNCTFPDLDSWWPTVSAFLNAADGDLENKRIILNVPVR
jgi:RHS repeat-associated protein